MRIVILGAGYAGLRVALDLAAAKQRGRLNRSASISLVDYSPAHQIIVWLHQVAAGSRTPERARIAFSRLPLPGVRVRKATVWAIEPTTRQVWIDGKQVPYDFLVIALGSIPHYPPIPGLQRYGHTLRESAAASALRGALEAAFTQAATTRDPAERSRWLTTVVAGGGYTGCQLAGELAHTLPQLADRYRLPVSELRLLLLEAQPRLLPDMQPCQGGFAQRSLERKGVEVQVNTPLERVTANTLETGRGVLPYGTLAWTGGVRGPSLLRASGLPVDDRDRCYSDPYLGVADHPELLTAGDCATPMTLPWSGRPQGGGPYTAVEAINQGRYLATRILKQAAGRIQRPYQPQHLGLLVSLGGQDAVGTVGKLPLIGWPAGLIKSGAECSYVTALSGGLL